MQTWKAKTWNAETWKAKIWNAVALSALLLLAAAGVSDASAAPGDAAPPVEGIDVSHHSGAVDWHAVRGAGYAFAYVKASEGVDAPDPLFAEHWRALADSGLARGAYHFYVSEDDPEEQARLFLATLAAVGHRDDDLLPVVDVELIGHGTPSDWASNLGRFLDVVAAEIGVRPMIYTAPDFWDAQVGAEYGDTRLWIAEYGVSEPRLPAGFDRWHLWQYDQDRDVPGVEKGADVNRLHPDHGLDALRIGSLRKAGGAAGGPAGDGG